MATESNASSPLRWVLLVIAFIAAFVVLKFVFKVVLNIMIWVAVGGLALLVAGFVVKRMTGGGDE